MLRLEGRCSGTEKRFFLLSAREGLCCRNGYNAAAGVSSEGYQAGATACIGPICLIVLASVLNAFHFDGMFRFNK
jgi:hypothetical protein